MFRRIDPVMSDTLNTIDDPEVEQLSRCMVPGHEHRNRPLRALLLEMVERIPSKQTNMPSGRSYFVNKWMSEKNLHLLPDPEIQSLVTLIENTAQRLPWLGGAEAASLRIHAMWAIVSQEGMEGRPHQHAGRVAGAYYVDAGACDETGNGALAIYTPQGQLAKLVTPETGLMLLFPGKMWHGVQRYASDRPRIVLSFNLL